MSDIETKFTEYPDQESMQIVSAKDIFNIPAVTGIPAASLMTKVATVVLEKWDEVKITNVEQALPSLNVAQQFKADVLATAISSPIPIVTPKINTNVMIFAGLAIVAIIYFTRNK